MKMDRKKANLETIHKAIGKKEKYTSLKTEDKTIIINELLKTTNNFCPFTGDLSPKTRSWTIEHFYHRQSNKQRETDWFNFIHCVADANINFDSKYNYPNVYSPEEVDYLDVLVCNLLFEIEPKITEDAKAKNTIIRYDLNNPRKIKSREDWFDDIKKYNLKPPFPFSEYLTY